MNEAWCRLLGIGPRGNDSQFFSREVHLLQRVRHLLALVGIIFAAQLCTGCASILGGGTHKDISFTSNPSGANVTIFNNKGEEVNHGVTPFSARLKRGRGYFAAEKYTIQCDLNGVHKEMEVHNSLNPWYFGNILFGGLIGMVIVDPLTGAMFDPKGTIAIDLANTPTGEPAETPAIASTNPPANSSTPAASYPPANAQYAPNISSLPAIYQPLAAEAR